MADDLALSDIRLDSVLQALNNSLLRNGATGMGTALDPYTRIEVGYSQVLNEHQLRSLVRGSWLIRRLVELLPQDMTKAGVDVTLHDGSDPKTVAKAMQLYRDGGQKSNPYERRLGCNEARRLALTYARWFGMGYIVLRVNGGEDPAKPLTQVRSFEGVSVLDRHSLNPETGDVHNPEYYEIARYSTPGDFSSGFKLMQRIHASRVLVYRGARIHPYDVQMEGDGGHDSVVQQVYESFVRHFMAKDAISKGLDSYSLFKVAISGLSTLLQAPNGQLTLTNYLNTVAQQMSVHRIIVQDTEASKSEFQERTFAGVAENFANFVEELTASTGYPHYKLWGSVGKAGLADSGGAETRAWAETVHSHQIFEMADNDRVLFHALFEAVGKVPKEWDVTYPSIYQPTPEEEANLEKTRADTYTTYLREGAVTASQVYQAIATGQPLENVCEPLDAADVLTIVDEAEEAGPSAEEELQALLGGAPVAPAEGVEAEAIEEPTEEPAPAEAEMGALLTEEPADDESADDAEFADLEQQTDSADDLMAVLLGWRTDKGKGGGRKQRTKKPNCTKGRSCGLSCIPRTRQCKADLSPAAKAVADSIAGGGGGGGGTPPNPVPQEAPEAAPAPVAAPRQRGGQAEGQLSPAVASAIRTDSLNVQRDVIAARFGADRVQSAESSMARILTDSAVYIRVPDAAIADSIVKSGRFKTSAETKGKGNSYQQMRDQIEELAFADAAGRRPSEKPVYAYFGGNDITGRSHAATAGYGNVIFQLKDDAKQRSTFSGDDSFRGQTPSATSQPNVASFTRNVDSSGLQGVTTERLAEMRGDDISRLLDVATNSRTIDDFVGNAQTPYVEAQVHGQLKATDIGKAIFTAGQEPSPAFVAWAKKNNVEIEIR